MENDKKLKSWQREIKINGPVAEFNDETGDEEIRFSLDYIFPQDRINVQNAIKSIDGFNTLFYCEKGNTNESLYFYVPVEKLDEFYQTSLPQFGSKIAEGIGNRSKRGHQLKLEYINDFKEFSNKLKNYLVGAATSTDVENSMEHIANNWRKVLEKINDPEVRKSLLMYQTSDEFAAKYGWQLSPKNVQMILQQKPDATFVTSAHIWEGVYRHTINPGAQRIIIYKPTSLNSRWLSKDELNAAAKQRGFKNFSDAMKQSKSSAQQRIGTELAAKQKYAAAYDMWVVFDVSDTTPMNPEEDRWAKDMGLADNLRSVANEPLQAEFDRLGYENNKDVYAGLPQDLLEKFCNNLVKLNRHAGIDTSDMPTDVVTKISHLIYDYAMKKAEEANIIKKDNQQNFAACVCLAVAAVTGWPNKYASNYLRMGTPFTKQEVMKSWEAYQEILRCVPSIHEKAKKELAENSVNQGINSFEDFENFLKNKLNMSIKDSEESYAINELKNAFKKIWQ